MTPPSPTESPTVHPSVAPSVAPTQVIEERPDPVLSDGDHERFSHIIRKDDQLKGYVMGETVTALCGKKWVPSRDPEKFPVCPTCKEVLATLRAAGDN